MRTASFFCHTAYRKRTYSLITDDSKLYWVDPRLGGSGTCTDENDLQLKGVIHDALVRIRHISSLQTFKLTWSSHRFSPNKCFLFASSPVPFSQGGTTQSAPSRIPINTIACVCSSLPAPLSTHVVPRGGVDSAVLSLPVYIISDL